MNLKQGETNTFFGYRFFRLWPALVLFLFLMGCGGPYGKLKDSAELTRLFSQDAYSSNYHYYYYGRENLPTAIIGILHKYELVPDFWTPIPDNAAALKNMVSRLYGIHHIPPKAYDMLDPNGREVGVLFSNRSGYAVIMKEKDRVQILTPGYGAMTSYFGIL